MLEYCTGGAALEAFLVKQIQALEQAQLWPAPAF